MNSYVTKGTRVRFDFLRPKPLGSYSIAGAQTKLVCDQIIGEGVVRNVWADDPYGQVNPRFNVELADGTFIEVPAGGVTAVID